MGVWLGVCDAESFEVLGVGFELLVGAWGFLRLVFFGSIASTGAAS